MITNEREIAAVSDAEAKDKRVREMFPIISFIIRHPLELFALAITLIGIAGFAAGSSFYEGWNRAAGISSNLFPVGSYETILAGITLSKPWIYSGVAFALIVIYINLLELGFEWARVRWGQEVFWMRRARFRIAMAARSERKLIGLQARHAGSANKTWSELGNRNRWGGGKDALPFKTKQRLRVIVRLAILACVLSMMIMALVLHVSLKAFIIDKAFTQGTEKFAGLYLAVTGKVPLHLVQKIESDRIQELACAGEQLRWSYRSVDLLGDGKSQAYIIQSTDKLFLLLDKDGSTLHSFGDAAFSLRENAVRPVSKLAQHCSESAAKK